MKTKPKTTSGVKKVKESDAQRAILEYLVAKRIFHYRNNSGAFVRENHFYRFGALGSPDIVCVVRGQYVGIEVKGTGGRQSKAQGVFQRGVEKAGGKYLVAYSIEDVENLLSGLE